MQLTYHKYSTPSEVYLQYGSREVCAQMHLSVKYTFAKKKAE